MKKVFITGGNFLNQGAFLMLASTCLTIKRDFGFQPLVTLRTGNFRQKSLIGADTLLAEERLSAYPRLPRALRQSKAANWLPFVDSGSVDAVIDISGFAFGDQWAHGPIDRRAHQLGQWNKRGVPVFLLPQAFGPFSTTAPTGRRAIESARLVFARDPESYNHALSLSPKNAESIRIAPDFTSVIHGVPLVGYEHLRQSAAIVPNWNIHKRAKSQQQREAYIQNLARAVRHLRSKGIHTYGLCHEGVEDKKVLDMVSQCTGGLEIIDGLNGLQAKTLLSTAKVTVSGRYHAIISALSSGTPTIMHGWSHKYTHLAKDFGVSELQSNPYDSKSEIISKIDYALSTPEVSGQLTKSVSGIKEKTDNMWHEVASAIEASATRN